MTLDPATLEVIRHALEGVADEMGAVLRRTAYSPNIKEREDCSAALFSASGELVAQAEHIPVHLGSMEASVAAAIAAFPSLAKGDQVVLNDPYAGGTHTNDITIVAPVFVGDRLVAYVANRAHHTDVGGAMPGSMFAGATDIAQEGLRLGPTLWSEACVRKIVQSSRTPEEREGDLHAQTGANARGVARLAELAEEWGLEILEEAARAVADYSEARVRAALAALPRGRYDFTDVLDDDGAGTRDIAIRCTLTIDGGLTVDLRRSDPQVRGNVNAPRAVAVSAACFVLRCLVPPDVPVNAGCWRPLRVLTTPATVVDARPPAAVGAGNVECSQRICDAIFGAVARADPAFVPAASQGTMNNVIVGGRDERGRAFSYYETVAGGQGGAAWGPGASGIHTNMTNTRNTPVEALEHAYPLRARCYELRTGSGGKGRFPGGDGVVRELEIVTDEAIVSLLGERRVRGPWGSAGGEAGQPGRDAVDGSPVPAKWTGAVGRGTVVRVETPGGGGWGRAGPP